MRLALRRTAPLCAVLLLSTGCMVGPTIADDHKAAAPPATAATPGDLPPGAGAQAPGEGPPAGGGGESPSTQPTTAAVLPINGPAYSMSDGTRIKVVSAQTRGAAPGKSGAVLVAVTIELVPAVPRDAEQFPAWLVVRLGPCSGGSTCPDPDNSVSAWEGPEGAIAVGSSGIVTRYFTMSKPQADQVTVRAGQYGDEGTFVGPLTDGTQTSQRVP